VLGLLVSVLIVGNVVSGAVVSGYRHIGVLKSLGFTPRQVVAVYLTMVSVPALAGCLLGTAIGTAAAQPILKIAFSGIETGTAAIGFSWWIPVVCLLAMPALVLLTALVPASRAHRLSAAEAISAGSAPATGRGLRVQRALGGSRLPRAVSMGLGQPFARPARTLLTLSAIVLGVTTVTLTTGLTSTMVAYGKAGGGDGTARLAVEPGSSGNGMTRPRLPAAEVERRLNALPGADGVTVRGLTKARIAGSTGTKYVNFYRGDTRSFGTQLAQGRFPERPGEIAAGPAFLDQQGLQVGDRTTLYLHGKQTAVTVVGQLIESNAQALETTWETVAALDPAVEPADYTVRLSAGTDTDAALAAVTALDPGLHPSLNSPSNTATVTVVSFSTIFTVLLSLVAALGVFNTVLLNIRERQRDLGMLKSIGMTPRQVVLMTVTSVAGIGAVGGLLGIPLGMGAHRWVVDNVGVVAFPAYMKAVWSAPQLAALALAGVTIAVLGALLPARRAARLTIARVLHGE
jgi:putative ABC transport system permease protein